MSDTPNLVDPREILEGYTPGHSDIADFVYGQELGSDDSDLEPELYDLALYLRQAGLGPLRNKKIEPKKLSIFCADQISSSLKDQNLVEVWRSAKVLNDDKLKHQLFRFLVRNWNIEQVRAVLEVMTESHPHHVLDIITYLCHKVKIFRDREDDEDLDSTDDDSFMYETEDEWSTDEEPVILRPEEVPSLTDLCFKVVKKRLAYGYIDIKTAWNASKGVQGLEELKDKVCRFVLGSWGGCRPCMGGVHGFRMVYRMIESGTFSGSHLMDLWISAMKKVEESRMQHLFEEKLWLGKKRRRGLYYDEEKDQIIDLGFSSEDEEFEDEDSDDLEEDDE